MSVEYKVVVSDNGTIRYHKPGTSILHRLDGPAIEYRNRRKEWYKNGKRHKLDGPAVEYDDSNKYWYKNGLRHRLDGPAEEFSNGTKRWYIDDKQYTEEEFIARTGIHTLTIDGKTAEISVESYTAIQNELV